MTESPEKVIELSEAVRAAGGRALLVGGCVRDLLLEQEPKDWDLEVYGVEPERLRALLDRFGSVNVVGEAFTVYKLGSDLDVSLPRRERKSGQGHRAFVIEGDPAMTFREAASRRDFTVNAILQDPLTNEIIDPFNGEADLHKGLLRVVSTDTFVEDSLRVLRAAQLAGRFGLEIEPETDALRRTIDLSDLPAERIWGELEKLLLRAQRPSLGLYWLRELGALKLFPEIEALIDVAQDPEWHPEGDVFIHTRLAADRAREMIDDLPYAKQVTVMLAIIAHDFGKPSTTEFLEGRWRSRGHEEAGVGPTENFLDRLRIHRLDGYDVRAQVIALVRDHLKPGEFYKKRDEVGDGAFRRLARKCELDLLYRVAKADSIGRNSEDIPREQWVYTGESQDWFIQKARELAVEQKPPAPLLLGRHLLELGLEPGPQMGEITKRVYELQLDGTVRSLEDAQNVVKKMLSADSK